MTAQIKNDTFLDLLDELTIAIESNNSAIVSRILTESIPLATAEFYRGFDNDAVLYLQGILEEIKSKKDILEKNKGVISKINYKIGEIFSHQGKYDESQKYFSMSLFILPENLLQFLEDIWEKNEISKLDSSLIHTYIDVLNAVAIIHRRRRSKEGLEISSHLTSLAFKQSEKYDYLIGKAESLQGLALLSFYKGDSLGSVALIDQSIELLENQDERNYLLLGRGYSIKTIPYFQQGNYELALRWATKAKESFEQDNIQIEIPTSLQYLAGIQRAVGQYKEAESNLMKIVTEYKDITSEIVLVISLLSLGSLYFEIGELEKARGYYDQVLRLRTEPNQGRATALSSIAQIRHLQGRLDEARELYRESIEIFQNIPYRIEGSFGTIYTYIKLLVDLEEFTEAELQIQELNKKINKNSPIDIAFGKMAEASFEKARGNLYNADILLEDAMKIAKMKATKDVGLLNDLYLLKTETLLERFKFNKKKTLFDKALEYILEAEQISRKANRFISLIDIKRIQSEIDIAVQNWEEAEKNLEEAIVICNQIGIFTLKEELEDRLLYIRASKELGIEKALESNLSSAIGTIRYAQGLPNLDIITLNKIDCDKIALVSYYLESKIGTTLSGKAIPEAFSNNIPNFESILSHQGTTTMMMLGQGDAYTEGLYILPCHKAFPDSDMIVYGKTIKNPKDPDLRGQEAAYAIISIIFPKTINSYISIRKIAIREIIEKFLTKISTIKDLTDELIIQMKKEICQLQ